METTEKENFNYAQKMVDLWLKTDKDDQDLINYAQKNIQEHINNNNNNNHNSVFLLLFNALYLKDQERIQLNDTSDICNVFGQDKSDLIKTIYNIEIDTLKSSNLIYNYFNESNITTKDISKIRKLTELLSQINENSKGVIAMILFSLFKNSSEKESLFDKDNIDYMAQYMSLFYNSDIEEEFIKSDAFKEYLPNMINDNKIEEIKNIINNYTNKDSCFANLKYKLTNIFDLSIQNNEILNDFIKETSYKLIVELVYNFDYCPDYNLYVPLNKINENDIIDINTTELKEELDKLKEELDENRKEGSNLLFDSKDIPDQFNRENFIELCFKVLSRITKSISYDECIIIHNQVFKIKSEQINSSITPKEVGTGLDNKTEHNTPQPHQQNLRQPINLGY